MAQESRSFLDFPLEIRRMIYQLLLRQNVPISSAIRLRLYPSILRTCRQILHEARPVLYGENIWAIRIFDKVGEERAYALGTDHFGEYLDYVHERQVNYMRKFDITVELQHEDELETVRPAIRKVCRVLSNIPQLDYMHLKLDGRGEIDPRPFCAVLRNFGLLRGVSKVDVTGVPRGYAQFLANRMTGSGPVDDLPKMYEVLELYAGPFDFCENLLQQACDAMDHGDTDEFKHVRTQIVEQVARHMADLGSRLYEHDSQGDVSETPEYSSSHETETTESADEP